jgi:hypothetical protein
MKTYSEKRQLHSFETHHTIELQGDVVEMS